MATKTETKAAEVLEAAKAVRAVHGKNAEAQARKYYNSSMKAQNYRAAISWRTAAELLADGIA